MDFCTLAMFIIDDIYFPIPRASVMGIMGGAGSYAAVGARMFRPHAAAKRVSWTVHTGSDFPDDIREEIESWETSAVFINTPGRLTTRSLNVYDREENRGFEYLTPKLRIDHWTLQESQLRAACFHMVCSPERCIDLVNGIKDRRAKLEGITTPPLFVWEPVPDLCTPEQFENMIEACKLVNVLSPNEAEFSAFFTGPTNSQDSDDNIRSQYKQITQRVALDGKIGGIIIRRGEKGCFISTWYNDESSLPAYHLPLSEIPEVERKEWKEKVVDPTGGGNAFLGGLCIGLVDNFQSSPDSQLSMLFDAAIIGSVAASFAIEQFGMPKMSRVPIVKELQDRGAKQDESTGFKTDDGDNREKGVVELWNGEAVEDRWAKFRNRVTKSDLSEMVGGCSK